MVGIWGKTAALSSVVYEIIPGFAAGLLAAVAVSLLTQMSSDSTDSVLIREEFAAMRIGSG